MIEPEALREQIRSGAISACGHGLECQCAIRKTFEWAVAEVYIQERAREMRHDPE